jgi:hypothetical protein
VKAGKYGFNEGGWVQPDEGCTFLGCALVHPGDGMLVFDRATHYELRSTRVSRVLLSPPTPAVPAPTATLAMFATHQAQLHSDG